jgi:ATP-dependent DNA ligase
VSSDHALTSVRLWSRNAIEWTRKVPELADAIASLKLKSAQLDGEMIVPDKGGSDFDALQSRLSAENKAPLYYSAARRWCEWPRAAGGAEAES